MQLRSVTLRDFKAVDEADLSFAPLTVLIGPNNAGKSSILHAIALVAQSAGRALQTRGSLVDLGPDARAVISTRRDQRAASTSITLDWTFEADVSAVELASITVNVHLDGTFDVHPSITVAVGGYGSVRFDAQFGTANPINAIGRPVKNGATMTRRPFHIEIPITFAGAWAAGSEWQPPFQETVAKEPIDPQGIAYQAWTHARRFFENGWSTLRTYRYVSASRHVDASVYPLGPTRSANPRSAQELFDTLAYDDELLERVSNRCQSVFGYRLTKGLVEPNQVTLSATHRSERWNIVNVGAGLVQMVWVVTQLELGRTTHDMTDGEWQWRLVALEEPELHLHPGRQPDMARILVDFASNGLPIVCTTQSEHLLLSLLTLVLEGALPPSDLAVYYVDGGKVQALAIDKRGRIAGGLKGFFEANEAQLQRQIDLLRQRA